MGKRTSRGFTLIELLVVIAVIGILASVILASLNSARGKARDAATIANVKQIKTALLMYYDTNGGYPSAGSDGVGYTINQLATPLLPYISDLPNSATNYIYYARDPGAQAYTLYVFIEKANAACKTGDNVNSGYWPGAALCSF